MVNTYLGMRTYLSYLRLIYENIPQIKKRDNCRISTRKDTMEEIQNKIKQERPVCDKLSGKRKSFPLSLHPGRT